MTLRCDTAETHGLLAPGWRSSYVRQDPMGRRALEAKRQTKRTIRDTRLSEEERAELRARAA